MKLPSHLPPTDGREARRGAALMLSVLVLLILVAVVFQINIATSTDARVARNDGIRQATSATSAKNAETATKVVVSTDSTPNSNDSMNRLAA